MGVRPGQERGSKNRGVRRFEKSVNGGNGRGRIGGVKKLDLPVRRVVPVEVQKAVKKFQYSLDTNTLMSKPDALFDFAEHDVCIPWHVLIELDANKGGLDQRSANARMAIDILAQLAESVSMADIHAGIPLGNLVGNTGRAEQAIATGKLFFNVPKKERVLDILDPKYPDHRILRESLENMQECEESKGDVAHVLVTKDKMMRILALLLGIPVEDYLRDAIDVRYLRTGGECRIPASFWERQGKIVQRSLGEMSVMDLNGPELADTYPNQFISIEDIEGKQHQLRILEKPSAQKAVVKYADTFQGEYVFGIKPRNRRQANALEVLLDPNIDLVVLEGCAGSGKNLLALAAMFQQIENGLYEKIIVTREAAPLGREQGYLPGDEKAKMLPWMGGVMDNIELLRELHTKTNKHNNYLGFENLIEFTSINSIRGRSIRDAFVVLDENQNSLRHQQQAVLTRVGSGSKMVCLGNFAQPDTVLTNRTSGFARMIHVFRSRGYKNWAHVVLDICERSELAAFAEINL